MTGDTVNMTVDHADFFNNPRMLAPRRVDKVALADGGFLLKSPEPLAPYARCV